MTRDILIIRQDHLGDLVLTTPLIRALALAGHRVSVLGRSCNLPVLEGNPHIQNLLPLEEIAPRFPRQAWRLGTAVRRLKPDLVMVPYARPSILLTGIRCGYFGPILTMWGGVPSRLLGCHSLRSRLLKDPRHISDIWLDLARHIKTTPAGLQPEIFLSPEEADEVRRDLSQRFGSHKIVIVHPGCSGNTCNLPVEVYIALADLLLGLPDVAVIFTGLAGERSKYGKMLSKYEGHPRVWNSMGEINLRQLCALIGNASCVVSVGTGPLHLASGLKKPTVSPFCRKKGICSTVWGNLGGSGEVIEAPASLCTKESDDVLCDFRGTISAPDLYLKVINHLD